MSLSWERLRGYISVSRYGRFRISPVERQWKLTDRHTGCEYMPFRYKWQAVAKAEELALISRKRL